MRPPINLRASTDSDRDALNALIIAAKASWGYDDAFMERARPELELEPDEIGPRCIVAECQGRGVGLVSLRCDPPNAEIERLYVAPSAQGGGIGRVLFRRCIALAREAGATRLGVQADPNATAFYLRMGMVAAGHERSWTTGRVLPRFTLGLAALNLSQG